MQPEHVAALIAAASVLIGIVGLARGWWESPRRKEEREKVEQDRRLNQAMATALLGTAEVKDNAGGVLVPKALGLVAKVEHLDRNVSTLDRTVSTLVDQDSRLKALETSHVSLAARVDAKDAEQDAAIAAIIAHTFDKGAHAALEAERLRAAGNNDTVDGETL